ncbi:MAG: DUF3592 domain-containing protein [Acidimicrobiales bacterium]|nr:MAG: DUF3592 domain-containing protein [Acidimicrobiales bacterium]
MEISTEPTKKTAKGCIILFGLMFFLAGLFVGSIAFHGVFKSLIAKNWVPTEAIILDASLKVSRGDEGDTYRATGQFRYEWGEHIFTSDQVYFNKTADSDRKFHDGNVREMKAFKSSNRPMTAYVNPKEPGEVVLYPKIRWGMFSFMMLFSVLFAGAGAFIMAGGQYAGRVIERENKRKLLHPDRPWLWKDEWQTAEIKNSGKAKFYGALGFSVFWNLISAPLWFVLPEEIIEKKNYLAAIGYLFPMVGIGLAIWTIQTYKRWKRFGETNFILDTYPAALGHALQGKLVFNKPLPLDTVFEVKLSCIYKYSTGSGDDRRTVEKIKWQDEQHIPLSANRNADGFSIPLRFKLPADEHPSAWDDGDREYIWRLSVKSELTGADFVQEFDIPVFDPNVYKIRIPASAQLDASVTAEEVFTYQGDWQKTGVQAFEIPGGHAYYFKAARHKTMGVGLIFMVLTFGGIGIAPFFSDIPIIFSFFFGGFALLLGWFACLVWLYKTQIETTKGALSVRSGMFRGSYKTVNVDDLDSINMTSTASSGNVKYYDINAKTISGEKIKMASLVLGKRDVQALIDKIKSDLGMPIED